MAAVVENTPLNYAVECLKDPWEDYGDEDLGLVDIFYEEGFPFVIRTSGEDEEEEEESDEKEEECDDDEETEIDDDDGAKVFVEVRFNPNEREYLTEEESKRYMRQMLESEGGSFEFEEIEKVNSQLTWNLTYYITFKAKENGRAGEIVTFQARVVKSVCFQIEAIVVFCRVKPSSTARVAADLVNVGFKRQSNFDACDYMPLEQTMHWRTQMERSIGFDVDLFPAVVVEPMIKPLPLSLQQLKMVEPIAKFAIQHYNELFCCTCVLEEIEKVNLQVTWNSVYYITFKAKDEIYGHERTLQARVAVSNGGRYFVDFCREKLENCALMMVLGD